MSGQGEIIQAADRAGFGALWLRDVPLQVDANADGWLVYPGPTAVAEGPRALGEKIARWRDLVPDGEFRPAATNEWIDLVEVLGDAFDPVDVGRSPVRPESAAHSGDPQFRNFRRNIVQKSIAPPK
ncbi:hypothetical protein LX15_000032 [Streptoalloteichus tenebrarius]|uniref:Uncharacterized protein n=1 Tax=Streptoalloteichus tenebrarius (strain ATCC 17920 / DSM 40477 / JCM 4838 / CBS 697.72 / NBRC 16177 / NCIMB 11028 / NRRL B-12390 / A12253. 1 / ISP 5477) TaxID=1933 RepID=A0ABT1HLG3_STRSD|nr:hypothetical protein [Streptoalloteichus tenebrarius]MCP2256349.1 hypothetical protein [Streptoalloteichus tenebrarius]BFF04689.1 hypothetical protein GCM10020241_63640 [Streptoalloteichus tenebrarius]